MDIDWTTLTMAELDEARQAVQAELDRRSVIENAAARAREVQTEFLAADQANRVDSEGRAVWRQPQGAHDAYPAGWELFHNDKEWVSLIDGNVWEPGVTAWREKTPDGAPAEWRQPQGAHDAYNIGDAVTFDGEVFESLINANTWSPAVYPQGWKKRTVQ